MPPIAEPPFRVTAVRVQDFRVLEHVYVELSDLTVLVGENNVGKSAFLAALDYACSLASPTEDDLHISPQGRSTSFVVDVRLEPWNGNAFPQVINDRFEGAVQIAPTFIAFRAEPVPTEDGLGRRIQRHFLQGWATNRQDADVVPVGGSVSQAHMRHIHYSLLDARRDLSEQFTRRRSHWGRLLADLAVPAAVMPGLVQALEAVAQQIVVASPTLTNVETELEGIRGALGSAISSVSISALPPDLDEVARRADVLVGAPGSVSLPLRLQGLGARSLAATMVFRALTNATPAATGPAVALQLSGFEEPEAHLHPQAHRSMFQIIRSLPGQKLISTHSPYVARVAGVHDIRIFRRTANGVQIRSVPVTKPDGTPTFNAGERAKVERFLQRHHGEALFSRVTALYEGETEHAALPVFASHFLGVDASVEGISLICLEGVPNLIHVAPALDALGINWVALVDGDQAAVNAVTTAGNRMGRILSGASPEIVMLPVDDYEAHVIDCGYRPEVEAYVAANHPPGALATYRAANHGQNGRDYQAAGWEDRLAADYLRASCKGADARKVAEAIVSSQRTAAVIPTGVGDLLTRAAQIAGAT